MAENNSFRCSCVVNLTASFTVSFRVSVHPVLAKSTAIVRQMVAVRFLIAEVWQRMSGMGRENGVWVEFYSDNLLSNKP